MTTLPRLPIATAVLTALWWSASAAGEQAGARPPAPFPETITRYVKLTAAEEARLQKGEPITRLLEADPSREVAVFGAIWVAAPMARYVTAVRDIEKFEKGDNFLVTRKISSPPKLEDFAALHLPQDDFDDLKGC